MLNCLSRYFPGDADLTSSGQPKNTAQAAGPFVHLVFGICRQIVSAFAVLVDGAQGDDETILIGLELRQDLLTVVQVYSPVLFRHRLVVIVTQNGRTTAWNGLSRRRGVENEVTLTPFLRIKLYIARVQYIGQMNLNFIELLQILQIITIRNSSDGNNIKHIYYILYIVYINIYIYYIYMSSSSSSSRSMGCMHVGLCMYIYIYIYYRPIVHGYLYWQ